MLLDALKAIFSSGLVWGAIIALLDILLPLLLPNVAPDVWVSMRMILVAVLATLGVAVQTPAKLRVLRRLKIEPVAIPDVLMSILRSGLVWGAVLALLDIVVPMALPNAPAGVWLALRGIVVVVLGVLGVIVDVPPKLTVLRYARETKQPF